MEEKTGEKSLLLPSLFVAIFANWTPWVISGLLLIEIAESFNAPVGITSQMSTLSSALAIIGSIITGIMSSKYGPKKILITGLLLHIVSGLGSGFAPNLTTLFIAFSISGVASAIAQPMISTLAADNTTPEERPHAMGLLISAATLTFIFGSPIVGYLENLGGWRIGFLAYYLPISLITLVVIMRVIPSSETKSVESVGLFDGLKTVLMDSSARSCLLGMALTAANYYSIFYYSISFFRVRFDLPLAWASILLSVINVVSVGGTLSGGRLVNMYGRKRIAVAGCALAGLTSIVYVYVPSFLGSLMVLLFGAFIAGLRITAISSLSVEQVPGFRGSMMSLNSAAMNIGSVLGAGIGGYALLGGDWGLMGVSIGVLGLVSAIVFQIGAVDPLR